MGKVTQYLLQSPIILCQWISTFYSIIYSNTYLVWLEIFYIYWDLFYCQKYHLTWLMLICTWKKYVLSWCWVECSTNINKIKLSVAQAFHIFIDFSDLLRYTGRGILKPPTIIMNLSIFLAVLNLCFMDFKTLSLVVWSKVWSHTQVGKLVGKVLERTKEGPRAGAGDMRVYWDFDTGNPGVAGWRRLCTTIMDREGPAYLGEETETMCMPGVRGQWLCSSQKGHSVYDYTTRYATKDFSYATSALRI